MARVTVEDCLEHTEGIFALVRIASKRARRIANGSETVSYTHLTLPTTPYV